MKKLTSLSVVFAALFVSAGAWATMNDDAVMVGGAAMYPQNARYEASDNTLA